MHVICLGLPGVPEVERRLATCLHWTFLRLVLPDSPSLSLARQFAQEHALLEMAEEFSNQFGALSNSKEDLLRFLFSTFPELPRKRVAMEYLNSMTGTRQKPIP